MSVKISICMGSSCFARGNSLNLAAIEEHIAQEGLQAEIELSGCRCENHCAQGPNVRVDGKL